MVPPPAARMCGKTARLSRNGAVRFTATTRCQSASDTSSAGAGASVAAALTSTRGGDQLLHGGNGSRIRQIGRHGDSGTAHIADAGGHPAQAALAPGKQRHPGAELRQPHRRSLTEAAAGPGGNRQLALQVRHLALPLLTTQHRAEQPGTWAARRRHMAESLDPFLPACAIGRLQACRYRAPYHARPVGR